MKIYTIQEVADILQVTDQTVKHYIRDGLLKRIPKIGAIRITQAELERFINGEQ